MTQAIAFEAPVEEKKISPEVTEKPKKRRRKLPLPLTFEERAAMGKREIRVPATWEEYLILSHDCDYRVHYREGHIISFIEIDETTKPITIMGEATITHERIVARLIQFLANMFDTSEMDYQIMGSNAKVFIAEDRRGYNPDVMLVQGEAIERQYKFNKRQMRGVANPYLIVEVLSDSTRDFDMSEKLADYKKIETLQQLIFIEQNSVWATTFIRQSANEWRNIDLLQLDAKIPVGNDFIALEKIYAKIIEKK